MLLHLLFFFFFFNDTATTEIYTLSLHDALPILPPGQRLAGLDQPCVALSPDGNHLAYVAVQGGTQQLYLRAMDSLEARPILGTEGATGPFFSPDGQWLGFFAGTKLKKISVSGGTAQTLGDATLAHGESWSNQ